ncbi:MAG: 6-bladed beta-propeller [Bacteroidales bacterium]|jgi:hypothetical protein|nr:6-bladed beta-propeller [Bacteroidales bacterium]
MKSINFLCLILFISSCNGTGHNLYHIDPRSFNDNRITLSEIADDIKYIQLDNIIPIGITYAFKMTEEYIYLSIKDVGIVQYEHNGKFVRKVGSRGKGPGEYRYGMNFTVDELSGNVFVLDPGIVKIYSPSGIFLKDISLKEYDGSLGFRDIEIYNSLLFFPDYLSTGHSKYCWVFLDTLGHFVSMKKNSVPPFKPGIEMVGGTYKFENNLFYYNYYNDTIFSISPDLSNSAAYLFAQGNHRWTDGKIEGLDPRSTSFISQVYRLFRVGRMFETDKFIVVVFAYQERFAICLIDKKTKKTFLANKYEETTGSNTKYKPYIINDLDGGMPLTEDLTYYAVNEKEYITTLINPINLKVHVSGNEFKNKVNIYPEKKKDLEKLANSLKETDNPVLVLVSLKK